MFAMMLAVAAIGPIANSVPTHSITGRWMTETRHGVVEIAPCGTSICGRLVDSDTIRRDPQSRDAHNKNPAERQRPLKGLMMLQGFHETASRWEDGSVYNPDDGGTYHGTITVIDTKTLKVRGCIIWPLCKSQMWKRIG